jgi:hypothetical protein
VDRFTIRQQDHPKHPAFILDDPGPTPNPAIRLQPLPLWRMNNPKYPLIFDRRTVRALAD